ncbi:phage tail sheath subtilisin-like domain-containing protein [Streptomyces sp. NPDC020298]|uniref:phage tail sheath family protein n=1 Tax=unclassified Streptomyces TaxID=2593676 RepID=UPI0034117420
MPDSSAPSGTRLISGVGTSTPAFLGELPGGPSGPTRISSWREFREGFLAAEKDGAKALKDSFLPAAVEGFFANGGKTCFIVGTAPGRDRVAAYRGSESDSTGLAGLEYCPEVKIVVVPDLWDSDDAPAIAQAVAQHCVKMGNRMALLHTDQGLSPTETDEAAAALGITDLLEQQYTAVYYPWVTVKRDDGDPVLAPPSGHVAGAWARVDAERGVHKAPTNEALRGGVSLERELTDDEQGSLNSAGVNCLRGFPGSGLLVWGARTLSEECDWKYLNVRRLVNYLGDSIRQSTTWAVFEPNDDRLWATIRSSVSQFLTDQWRQGALLGRTPDEAFYVICDESNNPPESVAGGHVICDIGVAPVRPAEFVHFTITQIAGQRRKR